MEQAYIVAAARTAGARRGGALSGWHPADLGGKILDDLLARTDVDPDAIDDVVFGCVMQMAEQACNVARGAVLSSRLPESVPGTSIDRQCGSSQQAVHFAAQAVMSGFQDIVIAGGVESMSRVPMGSTVAVPEKAGMGNYVGPAMAKRYPDVHFSQFLGAEMMAKKYDLSREQLDEYAYNSHQRAIKATQAELFKEEIMPLEVRMADGTGSGTMHTIDEGIRFDASLEGIGSVKLLQEGGRISAANASQICDGATAVMVVNEKGLKKLGIDPLARIHHLTVTGGDPVIMLEAPLPATELALKKAGMKIDDIDLYEVNEAFAPVPLAWLKSIGADPDRLNVNGGAIALGHPLGASGTKLTTTLLHALKNRGKKYGLQTMCEGGGLANVTIYENLQ